MVGIHLDQVQLLRALPAQVIALADLLDDCARRFGAVVPLAMLLGRPATDGRLEPLARFAAEGIDNRRHVAGIHPDLVRRFHFPVGGADRPAAPAPDP